MSDKWPWYTEWNGIYMPVGDALGMGCAMAIASIILSLAGYLIYLFFKLIAEGFAAAVRKDWGMAIVYWIFPAVVIATPWLATASNIKAEAARAEERANIQETNQARENEVVSTARKELSTLTLVQNIERVSCEEVGNCYFQKSYPDIFFEVTNNNWEWLDFTVMNVPERTACTPYDNGRVAIWGVARYVCSGYTDAIYSIDKLCFHFEAPAYDPQTHEFYDYVEYDDCYKINDGVD